MFLPGKSLAFLKNRHALSPALIRASGAAPGLSGFAAHTREPSPRRNDSRMAVARKESALHFGDFPHKNTLSKDHLNGLCRPDRVRAGVSDNRGPKVKLRKGGRVVDCSGLENRRCESIRGFESHPFRHLPL